MPDFLESTSPFYKACFLKEPYLQRGSFVVEKDALVNLHLVVYMKGDSFNS